MQRKVVKSQGSIYEALTELISSIKPEYLMIHVRQH